MKIDSYEFGVMKIDGTEYKDDVIVYGNTVKPKWWRRAGHRLEEEDLGEILKCHPDVLVVGQGASGMLKVPEFTRHAIRERGITLIAADTEHAWIEFNRQNEKGNNVAGAFHLTC